MTEEKIIARLTAEACHQTTIEGMRLVIMMAYSAGINTGHSDHSNAKRVACLDNQGKIIKEFNSTHDAARALGNPGLQANIATSARTGKWRTAGYYWKYV